MIGRVFCKNTLRLFLLFSLAVPLSSYADEGIAPDIGWRDSHGSYHLSDFKGRPVILHFWASWCKSCIHEMPDVGAFFQYSMRKDVKFVAISLDQSISVASQAIDSFAPFSTIPFGVAEDRLNDVRKFGIFSIPSTVVIGRDGRIMAKYQGITPWSNSQFIRSVNHL